MDLVIPGGSGRRTIVAPSRKNFEVPDRRAQLGSSWVTGRSDTPFEFIPVCVYAPLHACVGGGVCKTFFNIFVDPKFTAFLTPLFTKLFDRGFPRNLAACVSYACNAD